MVGFTLAAYIITKNVVNYFLLHREKCVYKTTNWFKIFVFVIYSYIRRVYDRVILFGYMCLRIIL